jgi:hypothetical protein
MQMPRPRRPSTRLSLTLVCLHLVAFTAFAADAPEASGWDRWGRRAPTPEIELVMGEDNALCQSILKAFTQASTRPNSLYANSIFLRWRLVENVPVRERERIASSFSPTLYIVADIFNTGRPIAVVKQVFASGRVNESIIEFAEADSFLSRKFDDAQAILNDPAGTHIIQSFTGLRGLLTAYRPLQKLPPDKKTSPVWKDERFEEGKEINIARFNDHLYVVAREPEREVSIVLRFDNAETAREVCYLGPKQPFRWRTR